MAGVWRLLTGSAVVMMAVIYSDGTTTRNTIELRVIVDRFAATKWGNTVGGNVDINDYVYSVFKNVNSVFKKLKSSGIKLDVRVVGIEIVTTEEISSEMPPGTGKRNSSEVIEELKNWLASKNYRQTDHTVLFTGLDLLGDDLSEANAGKAYLGKMCDQEFSLSVVEAPHSSTVLTIAHELGHSLNSVHDVGACMNDHIMNSSTNIGQASRNNYKFSSCSIQSIKSILRELSGKDSCLLDTSFQWTEKSPLPLGQLLPPDQTCKLDYGYNSFFYRRVYSENGDDTYDSMCGKIWCKKGQQYSSARASDGFICGNGKLCSLGECISSGSTEVLDTCPQGDSPQANNAGEKCKQVVTAYNGECYLEHIEQACCSSCDEVHTRRAGCEYGDKSKSCAEFRDAPGLCDQQPDACCGTCWERSHPTESTCTDKWDNCQEKLAKNSGKCSKSTFRKKCCASCADVSTNP